jgi:glycosyltransferase involved in cell wall biosynthesis
LYLAVSAPLADSLLAYGVSPTRIVRVSNGLDMTRFRPAAAGEQERLRRALDLPVDGVVILFVGFFSVDKGPHVLFDAWRRIAAGAGDGSSLVYVGATESRYYEVDATLAPGIRKTAQREGLTGRIVFAGETPTIEEYYRAADVFVFPTRREAFGMALVEAMASGLACIASRIPGVTDDIVDEGKTGLLVEPHDVGALSAALSRVLTDRPFADRLGHAAREAVAARFAIERTARLTLDAYRQLLRTPAAVTP